MGTRAMVTQPEREAHLRRTRRSRQSPAATRTGGTRSAAAPTVGPGAGPSSRGYVELAASMPGATVDSSASWRVATRTPRAAPAWQTSPWRVSGDQHVPVAISGAAAARLRAISRGKGILGRHWTIPGRSSGRPSPRAVRPGPARGHQRPALRRGDPRTGRAVGRAARGRTGTRLTTGRTIWSGSRTVGRDRRGGRYRADARSPRCIAPTRCAG